MPDQTVRFGTLPTALRALCAFTLMIAAASLVGAQAIVIDHTCTDLGVIPSSAVANASATTAVLRHASVGSNISDGLDDLQAANSTLDRSLWDFLPRGNPGWSEKITDFTDFTAAHSAEYQVFSMKFCYIDQDASWSDYRDAMELLEASHPGLTFVWWTMPIESTGDAQRDAFNASCRTHCQANGKILFDIADIECHDPGGAMHTDGGHEALYSGYTSDGGHLDDPSNVGRQQVARAWWHLMARISGWDGTAADGDPLGLTTR